MNVGEMFQAFTAFLMQNKLWHLFIARRFCTLRKFSRWLPHECPFCSLFLQANHSKPFSLIPSGLTQFMSDSPEFTNR